MTNTTNDNGDYLSDTKDKAANDVDDSLSDLNESFALMPQIMDKYETRFFGVEQSELYKPAGMVIPKLPIYHPYHPFKNIADGDDILQVPLAIILPNTDLVPLPLLEIITKHEIGVPVTPYFVAQTLPYDGETEVIGRYQYALFKEAEGEMVGHKSIWAQSVLYEENTEFARLPETQIKIYESEKNKMSPTILCGNSMKLDTVDQLRGKCLWSLVLGSQSGTVGDDGLFTDVSQAFVGLTYFIPDDEAYKIFLSLIRNKAHDEVMSVISDFLEMNTSKKLPKQQVDVTQNNE